MVTAKYKTGYKRFWASVVDGILLFPVALIFGILAHFSRNTGMFFLELDKYFNATGLLGVYALRVWTNAWKRAHALLVVDISETRILNFRQALLRDSLTLAFTVGGILYGLLKMATPGGVSGVAYMGWLITDSPYLWLPLLELITMLTNSKRRAIHNFLAGSVVIDLDAKAGEGE